MKKTGLVLIVVGLVSVLLASGAFAGSDTKQLTINATVSNTAKLSLDASTISFGNADPDATPSIGSAPASVGITAKAKTTTNGAVTLTVKTNDDLKSGTDAIGITNMTWSASGTGFVAGTMNKSTDQSVGGWNGSGDRSGSCTFLLANSWSYPTGNYSATATYTLTSP